MAYEMRISDWSSDVCSSDLRHQLHHPARAGVADRGAVELAFLPRDRVDEGPVAFVARGDAHRREARHLDRVEAVRLPPAADPHAQVGAAHLLGELPRAYMFGRPTPLPTHRAQTRTLIAPPP